VAEAHPGVPCASSPPLMRALVAVHQPAMTQILGLPSQVSEIKSSSAQVVMTYCIRSVVWHRKVAKPFKARPPELIVLGFGPTVPPCRYARLAVRGRRGSKLLVPHRRLLIMKLLRHHLDRRWSCSLHPMHGGAPSPASPGRHFDVPSALLRSAWGAVLEVLLRRHRRHEFAPQKLWSVRIGHGSPHWDALFSCRLHGSPEDHHMHAPVFLPALVWCHCFCWSPHMS
jgi:hypothetical protein